MHLYSDPPSPCQENAKKTPGNRQENARQTPTKSQPHERLVLTGDCTRRRSKAAGIRRGAESRISFSENIAGGTECLLPLRDLTAEGRPQGPAAASRRGPCRLCPG